MLSTNTFSDSQESDIINEETYKAIEDTFGGTLPVPENINVFDIPEQKHDVNSDSFITDDIPKGKHVNSDSLVTAAIPKGKHHVLDSDSLVTVGVPKGKHVNSNSLVTIDIMKGKGIHVNLDSSTNFVSMDKRSLKRKLEEEEREEFDYEPTYTSNSWTNYSMDYSPCQLNFQYTFGDGGGQDWVYSQLLERAFVKMEKTLPLRFSWEPSTSGLFLRTNLNFVLEQHKSDPVRRCHNHIASTNLVNQNMNPDRIKHVVHCVNHASSIYQDENDYLSILTPLCAPEAGSQYVPMCFKFFCKNSCPSGINRRPTELVFTLENKNRHVLARRTLSIRVCSCPKRDKQKGEAELEQPAARRQLLSSGKKMSSSCDTHVYKVDLNIVGKENYLAVCRYAYDVMAGQAARNGQHELFNPYMDEILRKMP